MLKTIVADNAAITDTAELSIELQLQPLSLEELDCVGGGGEIVGLG